MKDQRIRSENKGYRMKERDRDRDRETERGREQCLQK